MSLCLTLQIVNRSHNQFLSSFYAVSETSLRENWQPSWDIPIEGDHTIHNILDNKGCTFQEIHSGHDLILTFRGWELIISLEVINIFNIVKHIYVLSLGGWFLLKDDLVNPFSLEKNKTVTIFFLKVLGNWLC